MKKLATELAYLDGLIEEITTDANGEDEQLWAFRQAFEDDVAVPCAATVAGAPVEVLKFDYDGNARRGLTVQCRGADGRKHVVAASDVIIRLEEQAGRYLAAYRKWMGVEPSPLAAAALRAGNPPSHRRMSAASWNCWCSRSSRRLRDAARSEGTTP